MDAIAYVETVRQPARQRRAEDVRGCAAASRVGRDHDLVAQLGGCTRAPCPARRCRSGFAFPVDLQHAGGGGGPRRRRPADVPGRSGRTSERRSLPPATRTVPSFSKPQSIVAVPGPVLVRVPASRSTGRSALPTGKRVCVRSHGHRPAIDDPRWLVVAGHRAALEGVVAPRSSRRHAVLERARAQEIEGAVRGGDRDRLRHGPTGEREPAGLGQHAVTRQRPARDLEAAGASPSPSMVSTRAAADDRTVEAGAVSQTRSTSAVNATPAP